MHTAKIADEIGWGSCKAPRLMLLALEDPGKKGLISRELRLFACSCCRMISSLIKSKQSWQAIDVAERYADGNASQDELKAAYATARLAVRSIRQRIKKIKSETQVEVGGQVAEAWRFSEIDDWHPEGRRVNAAIAASFCADNKTISSNIHPDVQHCGDWNLALAVSLHAYLAIASREDLEVRKARFLDQNDDYLVYEHEWQANLLKCVFKNPFRLNSTDKLEIEPYIRDTAESIYRLSAFDRLPIVGKMLKACGYNDYDFVTHCTYDRVHAKGCWALDMARGLSRDY